jgi:pimeloyl-ACP methyl ester carboxylesterase
MKISAAVSLSLSALVVGAGAWLYTPDRPRLALETAYPASYLEVAGIRLRLRDEGPRDAPVLLLLHGFGASLQTWDGWTAMLTPHWRVVRIDLPGFGLTGPDPTGDYSDRRTDQILLALLDRLDIARATLIGNSMGGRMAWLFAASHPERVEKLVLVSPDGFASPGVPYGKPDELPLLVRLLPYVLPKPLLRTSLAPAYADQKRLTNTTVTRYYNMMRAPGTRGAIVARAAQTMIEDPVPVLARIQAPTLLIWGERDAMIPFGNANDYLRAMPHATLAPLPGLGHIPFEEDPARSIVPLLTFLSRP